MSTEPHNRPKTMRHEAELLPNEHLEDGNGKFIPAKTYAYEKTVREVWTNGSGMFGPADGIDRVIGHETISERFWADGIEIPGPVKLIRKLEP